MRFWRGAAAAVAACISFHEVKAVPDGFEERQIVQAGRMTDIVFLPNDDMMVTIKNGFVNVYSPDEELSTMAMRWKHLTLKAVCVKTVSVGLEAFRFIRISGKTILGVSIMLCICPLQFIILRCFLSSVLFRVCRYLYYTYNVNNDDVENCPEDENDGPINRLSRWVYDPATKTLDPDSEVVFFETRPLAKRYHNSGKIEFGKDGLLYVTCGDGGTRSEGQETDSLKGGIIRLTGEGEIPPGNPFYNDPDGVRCNETGKVSGKKCQELYAIGLRNPWRMAMDPNTEGNKVRFHVNDVGSSTWEEMSIGGDDYDECYRVGLERGTSKFWMA